MTDGWGGTKARLQKLIGDPCVRPTLLCQEILNESYKKWDVTEAVRDGELPVSVVLDKQS